MHKTKFNSSPSRLSGVTHKIVADTTKGSEPSERPAKKASPRDAEPVRPVSYGITAAAASLDIGKTLLWTLIKEGRINAIRIHRRTVIAAAELEAFIARNAKAGAL